TGWKYVDFFLRTDVKFHNGETVTAEDVKYSLETYMDKRFKYVFGPMWRRNLERVEIINPSQVRVYFKNADWGFIPRLWWGGGIMPKAYREKVGDEGFADKPIGAGPFKWVDYKQDQWIKLEAVTDHYRKPPAFKTLKLIFVPEQSTRLAMLKAGEVDIAPLFGPHVPQIEANPNLRILWVREVSGSNIYYGDMLEPDKPSPFHDVRVRRAVSLAIDRKTICEKLLFGASEPWGDVLPSLTLGHDKSLKPGRYDPEAAKKLLAEAGYPKGFDTTLVVQTTSTTAEALAANLAEVGIRAKVEKYEPGAYYGNFFRKKFRGLIPYVGWYDPERQAPAELSDFYLKGTPHAYYTTDEIDKAMREAMYAETDEQLAVWGRKLSKLIRENEVTTFLWANHTPYGLSSRIKRWEPTIGGIPGIEFETITLNE
ncbi:MAG: ABC transporter substrate-binding protein, partial [Deltaproteobacteria bacterium]|nr:ABC transporter substrate-binding protein [Deltaproteobacteria bacterium]